MRQDITPASFLVIKSLTCSKFNRVFKYFSYSPIVVCYFVADQLRYPNYSYKINTGITEA